MSCLITCHAPSRCKIAVNGWVFFIVVINRYFRYFFSNFMVSLTFTEGKRKFFSYQHSGTNVLMSIFWLTPVRAFKYCSSLVFPSVSSCRCFVLLRCCSFPELPIFLNSFYKLQLKFEKIPLGKVWENPTLNFRFF